VSDSITVFWSWQADSSHQTNRNFLQGCIEAAAKNVKKNHAILITVDRDTKDVGGTPSIAETILSKIAVADVFIWDASIVATYSAGENQKSTPNANVVFELGYAAATLGWSRIIGIMNTAYGKPDALPFDLRHRRWPIDYELVEGAAPEDRARVKEALVKVLADAMLSASKEPRDGALHSDVDLGVSQRYWEIISSEWLYDWHVYADTHAAYGEDRYFDVMGRYLRASERPENVFVDELLAALHSEFLTALQHYMSVTANEMVSHTTAGRYVLSVKASTQFIKDYDKQHREQVERVGEAADRVWATWAPYVELLRTLYPDLMGSGKPPAA
jgi:hypothetical protein